MLCEQCNRNVSTILLTRWAGEAATNRELCRVCAEPLLAEIRPDEVTGATFLAPPSAHPPQALPKEVSLPDPVSIRAFAAALDLHPFQVVGTLMRMNVFLAAQDSLDFTTASGVCARYGVVARLEATTEAVVANSP